MIDPKCLIGSSPWTSYLGYLISALIVIFTILHEDGIPTDPDGWVAFVLAALVAIYGRFTQDANVTFAAHRTTPHTVNELTGRETP